MIVIEVRSTIERTEKRPWYEVHVDVGNTFHRTFVRGGVVLLPETLTMQYPPIVVNEVSDRILNTLHEKGLVTACQVCGTIVEGEEDCFQCHLNTIEAEDKNEAPDC